VSPTPATPRADQTLFVLYEGRLVGALVRARRSGTLAFTYAPAWRASPGAFPLSLSLPLTRAEHAHDAVARVLEGYLPDRTEIRERLARDHGVASTDVFALLSAVGEDCPGAFQFARAARLEVLQGPVTPTVAWLTEAELADRLRALGGPGAPARFTGDAGYFSLAGAQPKIALHAADGRWGIPGGRTPTTHILKPPLGRRPEYLVAELVGQRLTAAIGLPAADASALQVEDQWVLAVRRYDRYVRDGEWRRAHQEDACQALGLPPALKYEREGAPGVAAIVRLLRDTSERAGEDVDAFLSMIALNWLMVGTDAHARNYSLLLGAGGAVRLAPFYDVATLLGIARGKALREAALAMQVGGTYVAFDIGRAQWGALAGVVGRPAAQLLTQVEAVAERVVAVAPALGETLRAELPPALAVLADRALTRIVRRARLRPGGW
jgi:serine/threonine-protein kinase HipA